MAGQLGGQPIIILGKVQREHAEKKPATIISWRQKRWQMP